MPAGNELAQRSGVGNETESMFCTSLRKLQYVRRRSCVRSANVLVLERLCRPPQLAATLFPNGSPDPTSAIGQSRHRFASAKISWLPPANVRVLGMRRHYDGMGWLIVKSWRAATIRSSPARQVHFRRKSGHHPGLVVPSAGGFYF